MIQSCWPHLSGLLGALTCIPTYPHHFQVDPDEVQVFKPLIGKADDPIIKRSIGRKQTQIVYTKDGSSQRVKTIETKDSDKIKRCFSDEDANILAEWCVKIEEHYSKLHGHKCPMDIGKCIYQYTIYLIYIHIYDMKPEMFRQVADLFRTLFAFAHIFCPP